LPPASAGDRLSKEKLALAEKRRSFIWLKPFAVFKL